MESNKLKELYTGIKRYFEKYGITGLAQTYVLHFSIYRTGKVDELNDYEAEQLLNHLKRQTKKFLIGEIYEGLFQISIIKDDRQTILNDKQILKYLNAHDTFKRKYNIKKRLHELPYISILELSNLTGDIYSKNQIS